MGEMNWKGKLTEYTHTHARIQTHTHTHARTHARTHTHNHHHHHHHRWKNVTSSVRLWSRYVLMIINHHNKATALWVLPQTTIPDTKVHCPPYWSNQYFWSTIILLISSADAGTTWSSCWYECWIRHPVATVHWVGWWTRLPRMHLAGTPTCEVTKSQGRGLF